MTLFYLRKMLPSFLMTISVLCAFITNTSCVEDVYEEGKEKPVTPPDEKPKDFEFSTVTKSTLKINYDFKGTEIPFRLYLTNPMKEVEGALIMDPAVKAYFAGFTDKEGIYTSEFNPPSTTTEVYLCSQQFGVPSCVKIEVTGTDIVFDMSAPLAKSRSIQTKAELNPLPNKDLRYLGNWNGWGVPDYLLSRVEIPVNLMAEIRSLLPEGNVPLKTTHPELFGSGVVTSVNIKEKAKLNLVFMHEGASIKNLLAYYHYPTGQKPERKEDIKNITMAFPNCSYKYEGGGLSSGDQIQLKYWNGSSYEEEFPAGTTIEWVLLVGAFDSDKGVVKIPFRTFYSTPEFNSDYSVNMKGELQRCVALYDINRKLVALGFEDTLDPLDFNDVVFTVHSTPDTAIDGDGMPILPPIEGGGENEIPTETYTQSGTLAFEDLWPNQGDYDMNDVIVNYTSTVHTTAKGVTKLEDQFIANWAGGSIPCGFGYEFGVGVSDVKSCVVSPEMTTTGKNTSGVETGQDKATVILFDDVHGVIGQTFTATTIFNKPIAPNKLLPPYNSFIVASENKGQNRKEVHLPNFAPTKLADKSLLGTAYDLSDPAKSKYYISNGNFPFAIHIPEKFATPKEGVRIDISYPEFLEWVNSNGTVNKSWYLHPKKDEIIKP